MKKYLLIILLVFTINSCSTDDEMEIEVPNTVIGTWRNYQYALVGFDRFPETDEFRDLIDQISLPYDFTFKEDMTFTSTFGEPAFGTYAITDSLLTLTYDSSIDNPIGNSSDPYVSFYEYYFLDGDLVWLNPNYVNLPVFVWRFRKVEDE
jgi:hypothetical protein